MVNGFKKWALAVLLLVAGLALLASYINGKLYQIKDAQQKLNNQTAAIQSLDELKKEMAQAQLILPKLENRLISEAGLSEFSKSFEESAKKRTLAANLEMGDKSPASDTLPGSQNFQATAKGALANIINLLNDLKAKNYFIKLTNLEFKNSGRDFTANINGKIFFK